MTKAADLAKNVDNLLGIMPGGKDDIVALVGERQLSIDKLTVQAAKAGDYLAFYDPATKVTASTTITDLTPLLGGQIDWEGGSLGGQAGKLKKLIIGRGLNTTADATSTDVEITVSDDILSSFYAPSLLVTAANEQLIMATENTAVDRAAIWLENAIISAPNIIIQDERQKVIYLQPRPGKTKEIFLIVFLVNLDGIAAEDGFIRIYVREKNMAGQDELYLPDIYGQPLAVQRQFKRGAKLEQVMIASLVEITAEVELQFHIIHSFPGIYRLGNFLDRPTAIMIQALDVAPRAPLYFKEFCGIDFKWLVRNFDESYATLSPIFLTNLPAEVYTRPDAQNPKIFSEGGYTFAAISPFVSMVIKDQVMTISSTPNAPEPADFYLAYEFGGDDTHLLRGRRVLAQVSPDGAWNMAGEVLFASWSGADPANRGMIITGRQNDQPIFGAGWSKVGGAEFAAAATGPTEIEVNVPSESNYLVALVIPIIAMDPMNFRIKGFNIELEESFSSAILRSSINIAEQQLGFKRLTTNLQQNNQGFKALRYTINMAESAAPCGVIQSGSQLPILLDPTVNVVPGSAARGGEGAIVFAQAVEGVTLGTTIVVRPGENLPVGQIAPVHFAWYSVDSQGKYVEYPDGGVTVNVTGGKAPVTMSWSIRGDFAAGDKIALRMRTTGADYAYLQSNSPSAPLVSVTISAERLA